MVSLWSIVPCIEVHDVVTKKKKLYELYKKKEKTSKCEGYHYTGCPQKA